MVDELGMDGNSSDESEDEDNEGYIIRRKNWRSGHLKQLLMFIDANRNFTNAYGNPLPGGRPHTRLRSNHAPISLRRVPACLPKKFYDEAWYDLLSPVLKNQLKAKACTVLPKIN